jgi:hypothetical protein
MMSSLVIVEAGKASVNALTPVAAGLSACTAWGIKKLDGLCMDYPLNNSMYSHVPTWFDIQGCKIYLHGS